MIEIIRPSPDNLKAEAYRFHVFTYVLDDVTVRLSEYHQLERPSMRHKFRIKSQWVYLDKRGNHGILESDIVVPPDVLDEVKQHILKTMTFEYPNYKKKKGD